jgi:hypothetical protein
MDVVALLIGAVAAGATLVSVKFARDAALAAKATVTEARAARVEEDRRLRVRGLERVGELVAEIAEAGMVALTSASWAKARADERVFRGRKRLAGAIAATGLDLPACSELAHAEPPQAIQPNVDRALDEVHDRIAELEAG